MIIPIASLIAVLLPQFLGGRLTRLADVRLRGLPVIISTLLIQILIIEVLTGPSWLLRSVHIATYLSAGYFVWRNLRLPGLVVIGLGAVSNGITIAVNGGQLPASEHALRVAGLVENGDFTNSGVLAHPRLAFLGDIFPIPESWPLSNVFSVGDILIVGGLAYASLRICGTRWTAPIRLADEYEADAPRARDSVPPSVPPTE
jgi:Family of unknown function (DUF5317)